MYLSIDVGPIRVPNKEIGRINSKPARAMRTHYLNSRAEKISLGASLITAQKFETDSNNSKPPRDMRALFFNKSRDYCSNKNINYCSC